MNTILKYLEKILIGVLFLYIIFLKECSTCPKCPEYTEGTTYSLKTTYDTIPFHVGVPIPKPFNINIPISDPITEILDPVDSSIVREYKNKFEDSLLIGESYIKVDGTLLDQNFTYFPKFPKYIIRTDSIFKTTTVLEQKNRFLIGGGISANKDKFGIDLGIGLKTKKDNFYSATYDPFNKTIRVGMFSPLKFKK